MGRKNGDLVGPGTGEGVQKITKQTLEGGEKKGTKGKRSRDLLGQDKRTGPFRTIRNGGERGSRTGGSPKDTH